MASRKRRSVRKKPRYFFVNGSLNKLLRVRRGEDLAIAWNYSEGKRVAYSWSVVQKNMQRAYSMTEVCKLFDRHPLTVRRWMKSGAIRWPEKTYSIDDRRAPGNYYFSEDNLREIHQHLMQNSRGEIMTAAELEAFIRQETILYMKSGAGDFVPVWKQPDW